LDINSLILNETDNVAVAIKSLKCGDVARFVINNKTVEVIVTKDITRYHKFATVQIEKGCQVYKYGQVIGIAVSDICSGEHVHSHNLISLREKIANNESGY
jgi:altronate dehydratase small subunit